MLTKVGASANKLGMGNASVQWGFSVPGLVASALEQARRLKAKNVLNNIVLGFA